MRDLTVLLEDRPGELAKLGHTLGNAGINIEGICGVTAGGQGTIHVLVEDADGARAALEGAGMTIGGDREVLVIDIEDRPGALGEVGRTLADAGVNVQLAYLATGTRLVLAVDDPAKASGALA
jgi:hypothetical protein